MQVRGVAFKRVNDVQKVCKVACCCHMATQNNERGAGKCAVKCLVEMAGLYSRFGCGCVVLDDASVVNSKKRKNFRSPIYSI